MGEVVQTRFPFDVSGATLLQSLEVIQYPLPIAIKENRNPLFKDQSMYSINHFTNVCHLQKLSITLWEFVKYVANDTLHHLS